MTMISYAQNFEDVMIERVFREKTYGFYIDVGAWHPVTDSVTFHFCEKGWRGINIEPVPSLFEAFPRMRPRDINLDVALGPIDATQILYDFSPTGNSTYDGQTARRLMSMGMACTRRETRQTTLARVCEEHAPHDIDFLKIDAEGYEGPVLEGADFGRFRPILLVVEATLPNSPVPNFATWEPLLTSVGYRFSYFDGLNRFYIREESMALANRLAIPPNFFDNFKIATLVEAEKTIQQVTAVNGQLTLEVRELKEELQSVYDSKSWKVTRPLRCVGRLGRRAVG